MLKSNTVFLDVLAQSLYIDLGSRLSSIAQKDIATLRRRLDQEGFSFLQIACTQLCVSLLSGLETGLFQLNGFFRKKGSTALPCFLNGWFQLVFTRDGTLRQDADVDAIECLYQFLAFWKKCETGEDFDEAKATSKWLAIERSVEVLDARWINRARCFLAESGIDDEDWFALEGDYRPTHSAGAVAEKGLTPMWKYSFAAATNFGDTRDQLRAEVDMMSGFGVVTSQNGEIYGKTDAPGVEEIAQYTLERRALDEIETTRLGPPSWLCDAFGYSGVFLPRPDGAIVPARLCFVPKDVGGPRTIICEALWLMYFQQGLRRKLQDYLETHAPFKGYINFTSQDVMRRLALASSVTQEWATMDLKDASDRVLNDIVHSLFPPRLASALMILRNPEVSLPDGVKGQEAPPHLLRKYAGMGSALCFPVEALVFYALLKGNGIEAYVYGDDIIIRKEMLVLAKSILTDSGLMVNERKTFAKGQFRESCGCDAYAGRDITPVRLRTVPWGPNDATHMIPPGRMAGFCDTVNQLMRKGLTFTARAIERFIPNSIARERTLEGLHIAHPSVYDGETWDIALQKRITRTWVPAAARERLLAPKPGVDLDTYRDFCVSEEAAYNAWSDQNSGVSPDGYLAHLTGARTPITLSRRVDEPKYRRKYVECV